MEKTDMASMHEAMEQQTVTVTKAGINSTLQSRCSVLGALNPKYGRFIPEEPIATQIDLPPALISRFDLIFALRDVPDTKKDTDIAIHIGARRSRALPKPEFEIDFIKKYIAYARSKIVRLTYGEGVEKFITKYYTDMRGRSKDSVSITARQIEGIYRLAEASARSRLSDVVSIDDARLAVNIVHEYLAKMTMDESGNFDIDRVSTSTSSSERSKIELVIKLLKEGGKDQEELVTASHIASDNLEKVLDRLSRAGTIYKDAQGIWRIV
jgi:replicative DNA helicase Mcm